MFFVVGLAGDRELNLFEAVGDHRLIVVEADDVGILLGQYLRDAEKLAGLVGKLNGEAEDAAAGDKRFVYEGGDRRDVDK